MFKSLTNENLKEIIENLTEYSIVGWKKDRPFTIDFENKIFNFEVQDDCDEPEYASTYGLSMTFKFIVDECMKYIGDKVMIHNYNNLYQGYTQKRLVIEAEMYEEVVYFLYLKLIYEINYDEDDLINSNDINVRTIAFTEEITNEVICQSCDETFSNDEHISCSTCGYPVKTKLQIALETSRFYGDDAYSHSDIIFKTKELK